MTEISEARQNELMLEARAMLRIDRVCERTGQSAGMAFEWARRHKEARGLKYCYALEYAANILETGMLLPSIEPS